MPREIAQPLSLADAEAEFEKKNIENIETSEDKSTTNDVPLTTDPDNDRIEEEEEEEEVIPQDRTLFPLFEEYELDHSHTSSIVPIQQVAHHSILKRITDEDGAKE